MGIQPIHSSTLMKEAAGSVMCQCISATLPSVTLQPGMDLHSHRRQNLKTHNNQIVKREVHSIICYEGTKDGGGVSDIGRLFLQPRREMGGGGASQSPGRFTPGEETRYPLYRRLGKPHGRSRRVREISPHRNFIPGPSSP
jgi:hypothetical protein